MSDLSERLRQRACPAGEPWTGMRPEEDHGHTDCLLFHLAADEIERLTRSCEQLLRRLVVATVKPPAGISNRGLSKVRTNVRGG